MLAEAVADADTQPLSIPAASRGRTRRLGAVTRIVASTMLGGVVVVILVATMGMVLGAWRFTVIDTGSMRPTLHPGDVVVLRAEPSAELHKGQIVAFHPPGEPRLTVMHRVFSMRHTSNGVIIQTKGDANNAIDPWRARIAGNTVWRETLKAPGVGYLAVWSQQRPVRFGVLIVIIVLIVSMAMGWIWRPGSR
jgi:signal peptidase I